MATTYPYTQAAALVNSVSTSTTVSIVQGMQVAVVTVSNPAGVLGLITLSPVQPEANNIEYKSGSQIVRISNITFRAQFGLDSGQVTCAGDATDQNGKNDSDFNRQIASWS